jgi:hypothetical protein
MRSDRFFPFLLTVVALVPLSGALHEPLGPRPFSGEAPEECLAEVLPTTPEPAAAALLDEAVRSLSAPHAEWLQTTIWQKVRLPGVAYEASGRYLLAPGKRFRLELETRLKTGCGALLLVSDGADVWQASRVRAGRWESVSRRSLAEVLAAGAGTDVLHGPTFAGVQPLLRDLRVRLSWVRREVLPGREQVRLTGVWPADAIAHLAPPSSPWPEGLPRRCRLTLDARTLWPQRVEWWGPSARPEREVLLAEMEFRAPLRNCPLSAGRCAAEFTFNPDAPAAVAAHTPARR